MKEKIKKIIPSTIYKKIIVIRDDLKYYKIKLKSKQEIRQYKIYSNMEAVDLIVNEKKSLSRFGDGEFMWILEKKQTSFQDNNKVLTARLKEVLQSSDERILISIPDIFSDLSQYNRKAIIFWTIFLDQNYQLIKPFLNIEKKYANTAITRPYIDFKDKSIVGEKYMNLKRIWNDRDIIIVEGKNTKLGVRNDLLNNAASIKRILCPSTNAFNYYEQIVESVKKVSKDKLILISLGPTATVLAYDLTLLGYQAIDTGHVDVEYEWYLNCAKDKSKITGKAVNEAGTNSLQYEETDLEYLNSIIDRIGD